MTGAAPQHSGKDSTTPPGLSVADLRRDRNPSPSLMLVAACCRWPTDAAAVRAAAVEGVAWDYVVDLATRHRVMGFVVAGLTAAGLPLPPVAAPEGPRIAARNLMLHAEAVRASQCLDAAGIAHAFIKGSVVAQRAFGTQRVKEMVDNDVLVAPADARAAMLALERAGYVMTDPERPADARLGLLFVYGRECQFVSRDQGSILDLHWHLHVHRRLLPEPDLARDVERIAVNGQMLPTLKGEQMLLHLVLHGARHRWSRLKWLADFNALLVGMPATELTELRGYAGRHGIGAALDAAMAQCGRLFDTRVPGDVLRTRRARWLVALSESVIFQQNELADQHHTPVRYQAAGAASAFLFKMSPPYWLGASWDMLVSPGDVLAAPLPRPLGPLYLAVAPGVRVARKLRALATGKKSDGRARSPKEI